MTQAEIFKVVSSSMEPLIKKGSMVYMRSIEELPFTAIVLFEEPGGDENPRMILHRMLRIGPICLTFGDNGLSAPLIIHKKKILKVFQAQISENQQIDVPGPLRHGYSLLRGAGVKAASCSCFPKALKTAFKSLDSRLSKIFS